MAAFVPRALAKPQKISPPCLKWSSLPNTGRVPKDSTPNKEQGMLGFSSAKQLERTAFGSELGGEIDSTLAKVESRCHVGAADTIAGLQNLEAREIEEHDKPTRALLDEGPEVVPIHKRKARERGRSREDLFVKGFTSDSRISGSADQLKRSPSRLGVSGLGTVASGQDSSRELAVETALAEPAAGASPLSCHADIAASPMADSAAFPNGVKAAVVEQSPSDGKVEGPPSDGRGGRVTGRGKKRASKQTKKVFPYGNYDRYYGYRFGKTLSEDPRLSVFQKKWFQGEACLDVGCNEGYVTIAVAQLFECASMVGVDIDGSLVAKARSHLKREAATKHQAKKPRLDLTGQANQAMVKQTPLGGIHTRYPGEADQSGVTQALAEEAPSRDKGTVIEVRKRKWVTLTEHVGGAERAESESKGDSPSCENGREMVARVADVSEMDADVAVGALEFSSGGDFAVRPAGVRTGASGADISNRSFKRGGDVSNGSFERGGDVSNGSLERGGDVSNGTFERGDGVSNGGSNRSADVSGEALRDDVSEPGVGRTTDVGTVKSDLEGVGKFGALEQIVDETPDGMTGIRQEAGLEMVSLTGEKGGSNAMGIGQAARLELVSLLGGNVDDNPLKQDGKPAGKPGHVTEGDTCQDAAGLPMVEAPGQQRPFPDNVRFRKENFVESPVEEEKYDVVMSLSVVKWIHLNWGDAGLLRFFAKVYKTLKPGGLFILEPQPWKSYRNNRGVSKATQRHFKEIKILPDQFPDVLKSKIGFRTADIVTPAVPGSLGGFGRAIHLFRK